MPSPGLPAVGHRIGPWVITEEIGRGGMGAVYAVRHLETGAEHALKVLSRRRDARSVERFRREAQALARLGAHPGLVAVHAFGEQGDGLCYCVMDRVAGRSLAEHLRHGPLAPGRAAALVAAVARAVHHAHAAGIVHRDIKPDNIIIDDEDRPQLVDFGLALDELADRLSRTGEILGTPAYMAPEQLGAGGSSLGPATDVWGLGATLYEAMTGRLPFVAPSAHALMAVILGPRPPDPPRSVRPEVPRPLEAICLRALAREPAARYAGADGLAEDIERFLRGESIEAGLSSAPMAFMRRLAPGPAVRRAGGLVALVVAVLVGIWLLARWQSAGDAARARERAAAVERTETLFARVARGDLDALAEARRAIEGVDGTTAIAEERRRVIALLHDLATTERSDHLLRALPPWARPHRAPILAVLLAAGRSGAVATLLEAEPRLLADDLAGARQLASLVASSDAAIGPRERRPIVAALEHALAASADAPETGDRLRRAIVRILGRAAAAAIAARDAEAIGAAFAELLPHVRRARDAPGLARADEDAVIEAASASWSETLGLKERLVLFEVALVALAFREDREAERTRIVGKTISDHLTVLVASAGEADASALDAQVLLERLGGAPRAGQVPGALGIDPRYARETLERERAAPAAQRDVGRLAVALLYVLIEEREEVADAWVERGLTPNGADFVGKLQALVDRWDCIEAILDQRGEDDDPFVDGVPGWALSLVATEVHGAEAWKPEADMPSRVRSDGTGSERVDEVLGVWRGLVERLTERPEAAGEDGPSVVALIDALHASAARRNLRLPRVRRSFRVPALRARWLGEHRPPGWREEAVAAVLEALDLVALQAGAWRAHALLPGLRLEYLDDLLDACVLTVLFGLREHAPSLCASIDEIARRIDALGLRSPEGKVIAGGHALIDGEADAGIELLASFMDAGQTGWLAAAWTVEALQDLGRVEDASRVLDLTLRADRSRLGRLDLTWRRDAFERAGRDDEAAKDRAALEALGPDDRAR